MAPLNLPPTGSVRPPFVGEARLLRPNFWLQIVGVGTVLSGIYLLDSLPILGLPLALNGAVFALATRLRNSYPLKRPIRVQSSRRGLVLGAAEPIDVDDIEELRLVPSPHRPYDAVVELRAGGKPLRLGMRHTEAVPMLDALQLPPGKRRARFAVVPTLGRRAIVGVAIAAVLIMVVSGRTLRGADTPAFVALGLLIGWMLGRLTGQIVVGADGFTIRGLGSTRFVPFKEVEEIAADDGTWSASSAPELLTIVRLHSGEVLRLRGRESPSTNEERGVEARAMLEHLQRALRVFRSDLVEAGELARRGREPMQWVSAICARATGSGGYRGGALEQETLLRIAESAAVPGEQRIGATAALAMLDESKRRKLRIAAEACADPELGSAMLALTEAESEDELRAALERAVEKVGG